MMKRIFDMFFSFVGLVMLLPFLIIISLIIIIESKGGVFYLQTRVGKRNKDFRICKFRTMFLHADRKCLLTIGERDTRITNFGYFLRKYKLDELPQLLNVFIGTMSFVGPRPEVRKYVEMYTADQKKVLSVKPGITDYASIEYIDENKLLSSAENPENIYINKIIPVKLELSIKYINECSFATDIKIILKTIAKIFEATHPCKRLFKFYFRNFIKHNSNH